MAFGLIVVTANTRHLSSVEGLVHEDWTQPPSKRDVDEVKG